MRGKLRDKAREKQSEHIPYVLDVFVESGDPEQDMDVSGLFDRSALQGVYEDRASVLSLKPSESDRRGGYNFSTLLDRDAVLEYSMSKRLSGDLGVSDITRLRALESKYGIAESQTIQVSEFDTDGSLLGGPHSGIQREPGQKYYYKAEASYNTSISGKNKSQIEANMESIQGMKAQLRKLKSSKGGWGLLHARASKNEQIEILEKKIKNTEMLNGKVYNINIDIRGEYNEHLWSSKQQSNKAAPQLSDTQLAIAKATSKKEAKEKAFAAKIPAGKTGGKPSSGGPGNLNSSTKGTQRSASTGVHQNVNVIKSSKKVGYKGTRTR